MQELLSLEAVARIKVYPYELQQSLSDYASCRLAAGISPGELSKSSNLEDFFALMD